jgi:hypothetical protein
MISRRGSRETTGPEWGHGGHDFSGAARWIAAYRDELILILRRTGSETDRQRLAKVDAAFSVVPGGRYKRAEVPWAQIEQARARLASSLG